ncbi:MAG: hypothetical protein KA981_06245 [Bacteroidia bacterium]|jgi:hypothetical protein|nr:hypothetical protein [Bacteroidia bacterium]
MEYPRYHKEIVNDLMNGKFILASDPKFVSLKEQVPFYEKFFKESFGYEMEVKSDFAFLLSYETAEQLSRDICMFFAILCYELDKDGKNFLEEIQYAEFEHEKLDSYFDNSAYAELIASNNQLRNSESRRDFLRTLARRNIVERNGEGKFSFTQAYKVFVDFAADFAKGKLVKAEESEG